MPRRLAERLAEAMNKPLPGNDAHVPLYSPKFPPGQDQSYVLAHGTPQESRRAILLSDSCAVETAMAQQREGRRRRGRLLFAPIMDAPPEQIARLQERPVYGRFPLPPANDADGMDFQGGIAELGRSFTVDVRDVGTDDRIVSLDQPFSEQLEVAWNATAVRRGPLVVRRNALKLAELLARDGTVDEQEEIDAQLVADVLGIAWRIEGQALERVSEALEQNGPVDPVLTGLIDELRAVSSLAGQSAQRLEEYQRRLVRDTDAGDTSPEANA